MKNKLKISEENRLTKEKTGEIAARSVAHEICNFTYLKGAIEIDGNTPAIDGTILAYTQKNHEKGSLSGEIPVQIKGTQVLEFPSNNISFRVYKADLKNYLARDGAIFFVVCVIDNNNTKIFYKLLLPIDLKRILRDIETKNQESKTLVFNELTADSLYTRCQFFIKNRELQKGKEGITLSIDEADGLVIEQLANGTINGIKTLLQKGDIYYYLRDNKRNLLLPTDNVHFDGIVSHYTKDITLDGKTFYNQYTISHNTDSSINCSIGKSITINICGSQHQMHFAETGSLAERQHDLDFLSHFVAATNLGIGELVLPVDEISNEIDRIKIRLSQLEIIRELFDKFRILEDIDLDKFTDQDYISIFTLHNAIINKAASSSISLPVGAHTISIGSYRIAIFIRQNGDGLCETYDFFEFYEQLMQIRFGANVEHDYEIACIYHVLSLEQIIALSNHSLESAFDAVTSLAWSEGIDGLNSQLVLNWIRAFDITQNDEYLKHAKLLSEYCFQKNGNNNHLLNIYQILKRKRTLEDIELNRIYKILTNSGSVHPIKCACHILLNNKYEAKRLYNEMDESSKNEFNTWPIMTLYSDLINS